MNLARLLGRRHRAEGSQPVVSLLKSPRYGPSDVRSLLPYRIDLLADRGYLLRWLDDGRPTRLRTVVGRAVGRVEQLTVPISQVWRTRRIRGHAIATIAMFESEAHGLAMWRRVTGRREPALIVIACWLAELATASDARRRLYRVLYRAVDHVVVFSANQRPLLAEVLDIPVDRITAIRFGVDLDGLDDVEVTDDGRTVAAVGRDLGRDWPTLAAAVSGTGWHVELITRPQQIDGIGLPPEIRHRPPQDRSTYLELLARACVVVVPTSVRAYPSGQTVLLEAMALGKACVVTDTPAMSEYVIDGVTALTVPPHDVRELQHAIRRLLDDQQLRASIGRSAREAERSHGGARAMWERVADIVDRTRTVAISDDTPGDEGPAHVSR